MCTPLLVNDDRYTLDQAAGRRWQDEFKRGCFVDLPEFFRPPAFDLLREEVHRLHRLAIRRDLQMQGSGGTPRMMSTVGGDVVAEHSTLIPAIYRDEALLDFLSGIAGEEVFEVPDRVENHVLNILHQEGDVHGGHVDTYAFAFNIIIEAPSPDGGGMLEFVPGSTHLEDLEGPDVQRVAPPPGGCYLLKTDAAVHRVSPLTRPGRRIIVNLAYANAATRDLQSYSTSTLYGSQAGEPEETREERPAVVLEQA